MTVNGNQEPLQFGNEVVNEQVNAMQPDMTNMAETAQSEQPIQAQPGNTAVSESASSFTQAQQSMQVPTQQTAIPQNGMTHWVLPVKKPMKAGWIITLCLLVCALLGAVGTTAMSLMGIPSLISEVEKDTNAFPIENKGAGVLEVDGLQSGKQYVMLIQQSGSSDITAIQVDGETIDSINSSSTGDERTSNEFRFYSFRAKDTRATIELTGVSENTVAQVNVLDGDKYIGKISGLMVPFFFSLFFGVIFFVNFVAFIVFLIVFLIKNSKYKQSLRQM